MARDSKIAPVLDQILQEIEDGQSATKVCKKYAITFGGLQYHVQQNDLTERYDSALKTSSDALAEAQLDVADQVLEGKTMPAVGRAYAEILERALARRNGGKNAARTQHTVLMTWLDSDKPTD